MIDVYDILTEQHVQRLEEAAASSARFSAPTRLVRLSLIHEEATPAPGWRHVLPDGEMTGDQRQLIAGWRQNPVASEAARTAIRRGRVAEVTGRLADLASKETQADRDDSWARLAACLYVELTVDQEIDLMVLPDGSTTSEHDVARAAWQALAEETTR